jgi:outer membrane receptor for ferric coprogen and ferric-rhodotorulic acid
MVFRQKHHQNRTLFPTRLGVANPLAPVRQNTPPGMKNTKRAPRMRARLLAGVALVALPFASMMSAQATDAAIPAGDDTIIMDIFDVTSSKDYGYLRTNSATATRIAMTVQAIPLNISILGGDFIKDANIREISDVLRYSSSASGDNRMGIRAPGRANASKKDSLFYPN